MLYLSPYPPLLPPKHRPFTLNIQQLIQHSFQKPEARAWDVAENKTGVGFAMWPENYHTVKALTMEIIVTDDVGNRLGW